MIPGLLTPFHDVLIRFQLMVPGFLPLGMPAPGRYRVGISLRGFPFTSAVGVIDRVLNDAARLRPDAEPARPAGFADRNILMLDVAHHPDRRETLDRDVANLSRGQTKLGVLPLFCHYLYRATGASRHLSAFSGTEFHVVDERPYQDIPKGHRVADLDVRISSGGDHFSHLEAVRGKDIAFLAVGVHPQG